MEQNHRAIAMILNSGTLRIEWGVMCHTNRGLISRNPGAHLLKIMTDYILMDYIKKIITMSRRNFVTVRHGTTILAQALAILAQTATDLIGASMIFKTW